MSFESWGLINNHWKTNFVFGGGILKDWVSISKVHSRGICGLGMKHNSVLCVRYGKWIHSRCAGVKMMTSTFSLNFVC